jgi:hypothetical protein
LHFAVVPRAYQRGKSRQLNRADRRDGTAGMRLKLKTYSSPASDWLARAGQNRPIIHPKNK